jgi:hypothetical protein
MRGFRTGLLRTYSRFRGCQYKGLRNAQATCAHHEQASVREARSGGAYRVAKRRARSERAIRSGQLLLGRTCCIAVADRANAFGRSLPQFPR